MASDNGNPKYLKDTLYFVSNSCEVLKGNFYFPSNSHFNKMAPYINRENWSPLEQLTMENIQRFYFDNFNDLFQNLLGKKKMKEKTYFEGAWNITLTDMLFFFEVPSEELRNYRKEMSDIGYFGSYKVSYFLEAKSKRLGDSYFDIQGNVMLPQVSTNVNFRENMRFLPVSNVIFSLKHVNNVKEQEILKISFPFMGIHPYDCMQAFNLTKKEKNGK